jgi:hypothetical protein
MSSPSGMACLRGCTKGRHLMNATTLVFLWLFTSLFMVHEFEEILLVGAWKKRNMVYSSKRKRRLRSALSVETLK